MYSTGKLVDGKGVVTNAGGTSYHNRGLAIDVFDIKDGKIVEPLFNGEVMKTIVKIAKSDGFSWDGDWKTFKDYPHFDISLWVYIEVVI